MQTIRNEDFAGERPLFGSHDLRLEQVRILEGESGIKCCTNIEADGCTFIGKYPWWHVDGAHLTRCHFRSTARSAVWYSRKMTVEETTIDAPKLFREMEQLCLRNVVITDGDETFWGVDGLEATALTLRTGRYPFMHCTAVRLDGVTIDALYAFQYCTDVVVRNAKITTKDAFWECNGVTIYDSLLDGEYLGWHSRNMRLVRCHIVGEQPLCYIDGLTLDDCTFDPLCDRAFEDSTALDVRIRGHITNIKNPVSGTIVADSVGTTTIDEHVLPPNSCTIMLRKEKT